jgi:hypothetical protein
MDAKSLIQAAGGRKKVMEMTGLTRGQISHWVVDNYIARHWVMFFQAKFPEIRRAKLELNEKAGQRNRTSPEKGSSASSSAV